MGKDKYEFMCRESISDFEKLILCFEVDKERLKQYFPQMYYCVLAIKDKKKQGYDLLKKEH